jgi:uncharacterized protein
MLKDLYDIIQQTALIDTHEHLASEDEYINNGPDVLRELFEFYGVSDLYTAGASFEAVTRVLDSSATDIEARWDGVKDAWELAQFTGYGEATRLLAKHVYQIEEITLDAIIGAGDMNLQYRQAGQRLHLLKDVANLDHVQIDNFTWDCQPDTAGVDFFLYDLSWANFCRGEINPEQLHSETGVNVKDLMSLRSAMEALFAKYGKQAIAVKAQHAYNRTLKWESPDIQSVEVSLQKSLKGEDLAVEEQLMLGNWGWEQGLQLAGEYNLPFKIHTGYLAGNDKYVDPDGVRSIHFAPLFLKYPNVKFVLMHTAYPWTMENQTLAKHFPNVYLDMCWAWSINPLHSTQFIREAIHSVPLNKIFLFGGDTLWASGTVAYAIQARNGLYDALAQEVGSGYLTEQQAITIALRFMRLNQLDCFDIEGTRETLRQS